MGIEVASLVGRETMQDWAKILMLINTFSIAGFALFFRVWMTGIDKGFERTTNAIENLEERLKEEISKKVSAELYQSEMRTIESKFSQLCATNSDAHAKLLDGVLHHKHAPSGEVIP